MANAGIDVNLPGTGNLPSPELERIARFKHFLRMGHENGCYQPGLKPILIENATCLREMLDDQRGMQALEIALQFRREKVGLRSDTVPFVLAACAHNSKDNEAKAAAYAAVPEVCEMPKELFAFVNYSEVLSQVLSSPKGTGWGRGQRKQISHWYNNKEPMALAELVTRCVSGSKWTHKDIFKLVHLKAANTGIEAIAKFIMKGWIETKREYETDNCTPEIRELLKYLKAVHDVKHSTDVQEVAQLIEQHHLSIHHVPTTNYKFKEIWNVIIPHISLEELLQHLPKLAHYGYLRPKQPLVQKVKDRLDKECENSEMRLYPMDIYLAKLKYEESGKSLTGRPAKNKPIPIITDRLKQLLVTSAKHVAPTGKRFLIAVDVRNPMAHAKIPGCSQLTPNIATALLIWGLWHAEPENVKVVAFGDNDMTSIQLTPHMQFDDLITRMKETPIGSRPVFCSTPITWAKEKSIATDVFIVCTDNQTKPGNTPPSTALEDYRTAMKLHAKLVVCAMSSKDFSLASTNDPDMLDIAGFDHFVPRIIHHFAKS